MFKVFTTKDFLEGLLHNKAPKNWFDIFMSGYVYEVFVPEDLPNEEIGPMGLNNFIGNLQQLGTTVKTDPDYINDIPQIVLKNPNAVFLLNIEPDEAKEIQDQYSVICQSIDSIDDNILTKAYEYDLTYGQNGVGWSVFFDKSNHTIPSNALIICDRYMFSASSKKDKTRNKALNLGLTNIQCILNNILPENYEDIYNVLIVFDSSTLASEIDKENKMFEQIIQSLKNYACNIRKERMYSIRFDLISIDKDDKQYNTYYYKLHNRRIISNYFLVRAEHKLQAFDNNKSTATQTIFYDALFSKIVLKNPKNPKNPSEPNSPIKSQLDIIGTIRELITKGKCRKFASIVNNQNDVDITSNCSPCSNRLILV